MDHGHSWPSLRSSPYPSSSHTPLPPATPSSLPPPSRFFDSSGNPLPGVEKFLLGSSPLINPYYNPETLDSWDGSGSGKLRLGATPLQSPRNAYSVETLESALSNLALNSYSGFRAPYYPEGANVGPLRFLDRERSDFDASRSTFQHNLPDHDHYGFANFADSSSSNVPIPRNYGGSGYLGGRRVGPDPCGLPDCSCHYNFLQQRPHNKFTASASISQSRYPNGSMEGSMGARRNPRQKLEFDPDSINLMSLRGRVVEWAKDQNGCRILQSKFQDPKADEVEMILSEVIDHVPELMTHSFGNYLIQKLIDVCDEEQRSRLLVSVIRDGRQLIHICFDNHGTRAVQKLLEKLTSPHQIFQFMLALAPGVVHLIKDMNGHHVIQHCLKNFSAQENEFLLHEVAENCFDIATDKSGCCVLQQCVDNAKGEARERLLFKIVADALQLAEDGYGNYVVQHVLTLKDHQLNAKIVQQLKGSFVQLSCNKFASHVVEKCLTKTDVNQAAIVILELLKSPKVGELLVDAYGNFVIQAALSVSKTAEEPYLASTEADPGIRSRLEMLYYELCRLIQSNMSSMRTNMFGRKILEWFDRKGRQLYDV